MFDYLIHSHESREANVDPELGHYIHFHNMMNIALGLTDSNEHQVVQGGGGEGHPDFRLRRRLPDGGAWRNACLIEPKRHSINLDHLVTDIDRQNRQIWNYLQISDHVLITNFWEFRLLRRNDGNDAQWPPVQVATYRLADNEEAFWNLAANPSAQDAEEAMNGLVGFLCQHVIGLPGGGNSSQTDFRMALFDLYNATSIAVENNREEATTAGEAARLIIHPIEHYLMDAGEDRYPHIAGQIHCLAMILLRSISGEDATELDLVRRTHIRNPILRNQYSLIVTNRGDLGVQEQVEHLSECLLNVDIDFSSVERVEMELIRFLDIVEPGWRDQYGFALTPPELVSYMVSLSDRRLREVQGFATTGLLRDSENGRAVVVDPCCGTGRFYLGILRFIFDNTTGGAAAQRLALAQAIGLSGEGRDSRIHAFDIQPACILMTELGLERLIADCQIPEDVSNRIEPSIRLTDSLRGWTDHDVGGELLRGDIITNQIKAGEVNLLIGNPPWRGHESDFSPQNVERLAELMSDWQERSIVEIRARGRRSGTATFDPYLAFMRVAHNKSMEAITCINCREEIHDYGICTHCDQMNRASTRPGVARGNNGSKMVTCYVIPQNCADSTLRYAMRSDLVTHYDMTIDLLGGDYKRPQGGNVFNVSLSNCIISLRRSEQPQIRRRVHFEDTGPQKKATLFDDSANLDILDSFDTIVPAYENWYRFYGGMLDVPAWPSIEDIRRVETNGLHEKRGWALVSGSLQRLINRVNEGIYTDSFATASQRLPLLWRGRLDGDQNRVLWSDFRDGLAESVWTGANGHELDQSWFRTGTHSAFNHLHIFLPEFARSNGLWNRPRVDAQSWGDVDGMICVAKEEIDNRTELRVCYVPCLPLSSHTIFQNANSHPLTFRENIDNDDGEPELEELSNLSEEFAVWLQQDNRYPDAGLDTSRSVWYHILAILSSPGYNREGFVDTPGGIELPVPIPGPDLLAESASLGRQLASLQTPDVDVHQGAELSDAISAFLDAICMEPYSMTGELSTEAILAGGLVLDTGHGTSGKIRGRGYRIVDSTPLPPDQVEGICGSLDIDADSVLDLLGPQLHSIQLSADVALRNVPETILTMNIGTHLVLSKWLAWRCESIEPIQPVDNLWNDLRLLLRNMIHMRLLFPQLDNNYTNCSVNAYDYPAPE